MLKIQVIVKKRLLFRNVTASFTIHCIPSPPFLQGQHLKFINNPVHIIPVFLTTILITNQSVMQKQNAVGICCHHGIMRHNDNAVILLLLQLEKKLHDLNRGIVIEIAGRFIR